MKKIPMRSCIVSREKLPKKELIRIVKDNKNNIFIDLTGKSNGRGAYLKRDIEVIEKAQKTKVLDKVFELNVKEEIYEELKDIVRKE